MKTNFVKTLGLLGLGVAISLSPAIVSAQQVIERDLCSWELARDDSDPANQYRTPRLKTGSNSSLCLGKILPSNIKDICTLSAQNQEQITLEDGSIDVNASLTLCDLALSVRIVLPPGGGCDSGDIVDGPWLTPPGGCKGKIER